MRFVKIAGVRLFQVQGEGPALVFDDRVVEPLDLYAAHRGATGGAGDAPSHLSAVYVGQWRRHHSDGPGLGGRDHRAAAICSLCSAYDIPVIAHGHAVPAALHIAACQSPQTVPMVEYLIRIQERNQHFHQTIYRPVDGALALPNDPGLGIDLDPGKIVDRRDLTFDA